MLYVKTIQGQNIYLRMVELNDCNQQYLDWLNNPEVNQFLETRWNEQSIEKIKDFVLGIRNSNHSYLFAIIKNEKHIGNIKIGPIHPIYKHADISYFIGDKNQWGKGIATEAIRLISEFGFNELNLHKLQAGVFSLNVGSQKALENNGYIKEAILRKNVFVRSGDNYCDHYMYGVLKDEWE